jgi:hypothetical protein
MKHQFHSMCRLNFQKTKGVKKHNIKKKLQKNKKNKHKNWYK